MGSINRPPESGKTAAQAEQGALLPPALLVPSAIHPSSSSALQSSGGAPPDPKIVAVAALPLNDCLPFSMIALDLRCSSSGSRIDGTAGRGRSVVPHQSHQRDSPGCDSPSGWSALPRIRLTYLRSTTPYIRIQTPQQVEKSFPMSIDAVDSGIGALFAKGHNIVSEGTHGVAPTGPIAPKTLQHSRRHRAMGDARSNRSLPCQVQVRPTTRSLRRRNGVGSAE
jgi:hypothetical protein